MKAAIITFIVIVMTSLILFVRWGSRSVSSCGVAPIPGGRPPRPV